MFTNELIRPRGIGGGQVAFNLPGLEYPVEMAISLNPDTEPQETESIITRAAIRAAKLARVMAYSAAQSTARLNENVPFAAKEIQNVTISGTAQCELTFKTPTVICDSVQLLPEPRIFVTRSGWYQVDVFFCLEENQPDGSVWEMAVFSDSGSTGTIVGAGYTQATSHGHFVTLHLHAIVPIPEFITLQTLRSNLGGKIGVWLRKSTGGDIALSSSNTNAWITVTRLCDIDRARTFDPT